MKLERLQQWWKQTTSTNKCIGRDRNGIEVWNRDGENVLETLFPEDYFKDEDWTYWYRPAGSRFEESILGGGETSSTPVTVKGGLMGINDFFVPGKTILEVGCGGGRAAVDIAKKFKEVELLAIDHEIGETVTKPIHFLPNLSFEAMNWDNLRLDAASVDGIISRQGVARYGGLEAAREITRVAKEGTIFRGDKKRGIMGRRSFDDHLCELGWNVWTTGDLIVARRAS